MHADMQPEKTADLWSPAAKRARGNASWWWPPLRRAGIGLLFLVVVVLLVRHAREVDWSAVAVVVRAYSLPTLAVAAGLAVASYLLYGTYDLIGRRQVRHCLRAGQVMAVAFVSYAFNLNLGALVGGVAVRLRLYSRLGLKPETIAEVLALSMVTNWLGYLVLAGGAFILFPPTLPANWPLGSGGVRIVGLSLLVLALAYLLTCFFARRRVWQLRGRCVSLPSGSLALVQLVLSCANWMLIAGVLAVLLQGRLEYSAVLSALLIAAVAGVVAHIPAGLGVLEAVFIALLSHRVPVAELLGALIAYRAVYYLLPLTLALPCYFVLEARGKQEVSQQQLHETVDRRALLRARQKLP